MTRMWMIEPELMCRQHLLGEHKEIHQLIGTIKKGISIAGYVNKKIIEPVSIYARHDCLAKEMLKRGYNHKSILPYTDLMTIPKNHRICKVNINRSIIDLLHRCPECYKRIKLWQEKNP